MDVNHVLEKVERLRNLFPVVLCGWVAVASLLLVIQMLLQLALNCPCNDYYNVVYGVLYFLVPGVAFEILNHLLFNYRKRYPYLVRAPLPTLVWCALVFLDRKTFACLKTKSCIGPNSEAIVCKVFNRTATYEEESCFDHLNLESLIIGLCLLLLIVIVSLIEFICFLRYHRLLQQVTDGVTDSENSSASQQGTPGAWIPDPASAGGTGPVHRDEEPDNNASDSQETDPLLGGGKRLQRGDQSQRSRQHYGRL